MPLDRNNPPVSRSSSPAQLLASLQKQLELLHQLAVLVQAQSAMIRNGETEQLLNLLGQRQRLIDEFVAAQSDLGHLMQVFESAVGTWPASDRDVMKSLLGQISDKLTWVMNRDEIDQAHLRTAGSNVKSELSSITVTQQARGAYRPAVSSAARFADQCG